MYKDTPATNSDGAARAVDGHADALPRPIAPEDYPELVAKLQRQIESERTDHIARMNAMIAHAPAAIAALRGKEMIFEVANPEYLTLIGRTDILGMSVREVFPELVGQGFFEILDEVWDTGKPYIAKGSQIFLQRQGSAELTEAFIDFVDQPVFDAEGDIESIFVVAYDVTELTQAKLEAERERTRAEDSEKALTTFIDNLPELAWTARPDGHIDFYNRRWYEYTGTTFEEMQGWGWEKVHEPDMLPKVTERWKRSLETGEPFEMEFTLLGSDGVRRWFLTRVEPTRNEAGEITRWFGTNTNIDRLNSEIAWREKLEEEKEELLEAERSARAQLESMSERKDRFIALMSHELRSPLNAILGWIQVLQMREEDDAELEMALEVMERNALGQAALIQEIVDYERLTSGKLSLSIETLDLSRSVEKTLQDLEPAITNAGLTLDRDIDHAIYVHGDPARLSQIVRNIVENAIKFTPKQGKIVLELHSEAEEAVIRITDTGAGIPERSIEKIFDRFYQIDTTSHRSANGLGLGLAIVRMLTEMQGGSVVAYSEGAGKGSVFTLRFPQASEDEVPKGKASSSSEATPNSMSLHGKHVLVVDDLSDARDVLAEMLTRLGAMVETVSSAREALQWLEANTTDVLLSDIEMPIEDGYTLIRRLREKEGDVRKLPSIALTAHARPQDRERSLAAGFDAHMNKPVNTAELVRELTRLLRAS